MDLSDYIMRNGQETKIPVKIRGRSSVPIPFPGRSRAIIIIGRSPDL